MKTIEVKDRVIHLNYIPSALEILSWNSMYLHRTHTQVRHHNLLGFSNPKGSDTYKYAFEMKQTMIVIDGMSLNYNINLSNEHNSPTFVVNINRLKITTITNNQLAELLYLQTEVITQLEKQLGI